MMNAINTLESDNRGRDARGEGRWWWWRGLVLYLFRFQLVYKKIVTQSNHLISYCYNMYHKDTLKNK